MIFSLPTDPVRYVRLVAVMARCLALAWDARVSADRCRRERQRRVDGRAR